MLNIKYITKSAIFFVACSLIICIAMFWYHIYNGYANQFFESEIKLEIVSDIWNNGQWLVLENTKNRTISLKSKIRLYDNIYNLSYEKRVSLSRSISIFFVKKQQLYPNELERLDFYLTILKRLNSKKQSLWENQQDKRLDTIKHLINLFILRIESIEEKNMLNLDHNILWWWIDFQTIFAISENDNNAIRFVDSNYHSLYYFSWDTKNLSNCEWECLEQWPIYYWWINSNKWFDVIIRKDGLYQTTFKGHPLYRYSWDKEQFEYAGNWIWSGWYRVELELLQ